MKQLTVTVPENKFRFIHELLKNLSFVKIEKNTEPSKAEILRSIEQGLKEVELIRQGKLPKKSIEKLLQSV
jgi:hypothetical protein